MRLRPKECSDRQPRSFWLAVAAVALLTIFYLAWMIFGFGGPRDTRWFDDVAEGVTPVLAAIACGVVAYRSKGNRACWLLLGVSAAAWAGGEAVWCYYDIGLGVPIPFPSLADAGYLTAVPLAVAGLLLFPSAPQRLASRVRGLIDGLLIAGGLLYVSWATVLGPLYQTHQDGLLAKLLSLAYPAGDVVLASLVLILATRPGQRGIRTPLLFVMVAIFSFALSDSSFAYLTQVHNYSGTIANVLDVGWFAGYLVLGLGALAALSSSAIATRSEDHVTLGSIVIPYAPVAVAGVLTLTRLVSHKPLGLFLSIEGLGLVIMLSTRQMITLVDNMSLNRKLNAKVEMGTAELRAREARFSALVQKASDLVTIVDLDGNVIFQSPSVERVLGWESQSAVGTNLLSLMHGSDRQKWNVVVNRVLAMPQDEVVNEWRFRHADNSWRFFQSVVTNLLDEPSVAGLVLNSRDITDQKELENQLRHQAFHDPLTGLANRALFSEHLAHAVRRRMRSGAVLGVLFVDLDDFKSVNDLRGHALGDAVLTAVAERLRETLRDADLIARLGGDEFAVLLEDISPRWHPREAAERLLHSFERPFSIGDTVVNVNASIGLVVDEFGSDTAEDLLRNADLAMYAAKAGGKRSYEIYSPDMHSSILERMEIECELQHSIERGEMVLHYQPVMDVVTGVVKGVEALIRWRHPERGLIPPSEFIGVAESSGLIVQIGTWVLQEACSTVQSWSGGFEDELGVSVNLSARQISDSDLLAVVQHALDSSGLKPERLTLEITESMIMKNIARTAEVLTQLRSLGVKIAIDDFGTGYSSLGSLRDFPVDTLKIDRAFVSDIATSVEDARLAKTILQMASDLHLHTVAEGVEEPEQLATLAELGCESVQGFLLARPLPAQEAAILLDNLFRASQLERPRVDLNTRL